MQELQDLIKVAAKEAFGVDIEPELSRPEEQFGDYTTNVALQLAAELGKKPHEIANQLVKMLQSLLVNKTEVAGPGFINFTLSDGTIAKAAFSATDLPKPNAGQVVVLEHTDPNPFKEFHIGHAYSNTVGVAIGKLLESSGTKVHQVSYHGDVGLHIAMAVWAIQKEGFDAGSLRQKLLKNIGFYYAKGAQAYRDDPLAKREIEEINKHIYARDDSAINQIYNAGRDGSLKHFEYIYSRLGVSFEKNYFESETAMEGEKIVKEYTGKVFASSDGAIVYDGEKAGLHKRVFITGQDLPTYETKEIGLAFAKQRDYPDAQKFIVITANEIDDYFRVLIAAIKEIDLGLGEKIMHLSHGVVKFPEGKMSSRSGNVKLFSGLEVDIEEALKKLYKTNKADVTTVLGAIKYEFLKHRLGSDFIFDVGESISLEGNSGPYLQYALVRARSILQKSKDPSTSSGQAEIANFETGERSLARKIGEYPEVVEKAVNELMPHHVATYLYELAQTFNRFYENNRVVGDPREALRLQLVQSYSNVLKNGLELLNIPVPERM